VLSTSQLCCPAPCNMPCNMPKQEPCVQQHCLHCPLVACRLAYYGLQTNMGLCKFTPGLALLQTLLHQQTKLIALS
jgi:hypothetical protein